MGKIISFETFPKAIHFLVLVLCFYLAAPLYDMPLLGLSLSAPMIFLLTYDISKRKGGFQTSRYSQLVSFLAIFVFGLSFSLSWNAIVGDLQTNFFGSLKYLVRFTFWGLSALLACRLFALTNLPEKAGRTFAFGVSIMSIFILIEFLVFGGLHSSGWSQLTTLSQNSYALQFSIFLPFVYASFAEARGKGRLYWSAAMALCLSAVIMNSSRSSWGITLITLVIFCVLYALVVKRISIILTVICLGLVFVYGGWVMAPENIKDNISHEFGTFEDLEQDKSWMIRQLQIQKGLSLFERNPVFGVGPGQFRFHEVELALPEVFRNRSSSEFNNRSAHNSYIQFLAEGGLVFMVPFVLLQAWLTVAGGRAALKLCSRGENWGLALFTGFIGMSVHLWTVSGLTSTAPWFMYGMVAAMIYRVRWLCHGPVVVQKSCKGGRFATRIPLPHSR